MRRLHFQAHEHNRPHLLRSIQPNEAQLLIEDMVPTCTAGNPSSLLVSSLVMTS